jgi:predicted Zn-dependent protease
VCFSIPEGWRERDATAEFDPLTSMITSGQALIAVGPLEDVPTARDAAKRARYLLLGLLGAGPQVTALYEKSGTVEGHPSATASDTARGTWAMVTVIEMENGMVGMISSVPEHEAALIAQIEEVHESLAVQ